MREFPQGFPMDFSIFPWQVRPNIWAPSRSPTHGSTAAWCKWPALPERLGLEPFFCFRCDRYKCILYSRYTYILYIYMYIFIYIYIHIYNIHYKSSITCVHIYIYIHITLICIFTIWYLHIYLYIWSVLYLYMDPSSGFMTYGLCGNRIPQDPMVYRHVPSRIGINGVVLSSHNPIYWRVYIYICYIW